ncbi:hypothetical protein AJ79_01584 [Helicocarpus griseus UAMH5409]|uniref:Uncharacterized protein n=1 Tax=Helicocarpus griseus UAMH5409 TaxID=1447875 RepID=A0A2B7Y6Q0_9EURO|nr:hypothetical protein AJ79_01584 [Helicocarpus griseus UAMH5409]
MLYQQYIDPFLHHHEREIEQFITQAHDKAKAAGLDYFYKAVDFFREKVLGLPPAAASAPPPPTPQVAGATAFAQSLLSRFTIPGTTTAASTLVSPAADLYSLVSAAVSSASSSKSRDAQAAELSASGKLIPDKIASASKAEQAEYIASQKERLGVLLSAFDREQRNLRLTVPAGGSVSGDRNDDLAYGTSYDEHERGGGGGLRKNRSDVSFENIEHEDLLTGDHYGQYHRRTGRSSGDADMAEFARRSVDEVARASGVYR